MSIEVLPSARVASRLAAAVMLVFSLSACDLLDYVVGKRKEPLQGERLSVFAERGELEPDKDMASVQVVLPAPTVNDSWPQSGGFANYAMHNLAVSDSPQIIWTADVGAGSSSSRILTTPPIVAEGKVFAKDAQSTVSAFNADTGQLVWRVTLKPEKARDGDEFGGGLAYYGGRLFVTTGFATVYSLDPANGKRIARLFRDRFTELDPAGAATYTANLGRFEAALDQAAAEWAGARAGLKGKPIVAWHTSWRYFAEYTGVNIVGFMEPKPGVPPSPSHLAGLILTMKRTGAKVIIMEPYYDRKTADFVAAKAGATVLVLPPSVGGTKGADDYIGMMRHNIQALAKAVE